MQIEYLINSVVVFGLYISVYLIILSDLLNRYDNEINNFSINGTKLFNVTYINYFFITVGYLLLIQVFLQLFNFSKSIVTTVSHVIYTLIMSIIFLGFFAILYIGYVLYKQNPIYLLYLGIVLVGIPIVLFFFYKFFVVIKNTINNRGKKQTNETVITSINKSVNSANNNLKMKDTKEKKSFFSWIFGDGNKSDVKYNNQKPINTSQVTTNSKNINNKFKGKTTLEKVNSLYSRIQLELSVLPNSVKMLIGAEFILIGLYLFKKLGVSSVVDIYKPKGIYLTRNSLSLSKANRMGNYEEMKNKLHSKELHNYNYGLSMWLKINPKGQLNTFTNIFNYGYNPYIEYNEMNNTLRVIMTDDMENRLVIYESKDFLIQRWNHIVINYYGNYFDVIINGKLVGTARNIAPYLNESPLVIGSNDNLNGIIKEVVYFSKPLSISSIQRINDGFYLNENNTSIEQDFGIDIMKSIDLGIFSSITNFFNYSVEGVNNNIIKPTFNFFTGAANENEDETVNAIKEAKNISNKISKDTENNFDKLSKESKKQVNKFIRDNESESKNVGKTLEDSV